MLAIFSIYRLKFLIFLVFLFLSSFYTNEIQSNEIDLEKDTYYYEKLAEKWDDIFPDGNRNAAGPKFFKFLIEQDLEFDEFVEYNKRYCPVSGSLIRPGSEPFLLSLNEDITNNKVCGDVYVCCWPCSCDSMKYANTMEISHSFKGVKEEFTVLTIKNPCAKDDFPLEINREYFCKGADMNKDQVYSVDDNMVIGFLHSPRSCSNNDILAVNDHSITGKQCKVRNSTKEDELISGMGDIFINLAN